MENFNGDKYITTLLDDFVKNYQYHSYVKIRALKPVKKKVTWNKKLITYY
jgi:hypothetical protein